MAPVVRRVEQLRGLKFEHPVPVVTLDEDAYREHVEPATAGFTDAQRKAVELARARLSALGLVDRDVDLTHALANLVGIDSAAVYDPRTKRIYVRGTQPPLVRRVILSHELTHALDDQHFGLVKVQAAASNHGSTAVRALIEGDAERVRTRYFAALSAADQARYRALVAPRAVQVRADLADEGVPDGLLVFFTAPYVLGVSMIDTATRGKATAIDRLFHHPPVLDVSLLTPVTLVDGAHFRNVARPEHDASEKPLDGFDSLGALSLYLVLAEHVPLADALAAADGWVGDWMLTFHRAGAVCVRDRVAGRSSDDTDHIAAALNTWARAMPADNVDVYGDADAVVVTACDQAFDERTVSLPVAPERALAFVGDRNLLVAFLVGRGVAPGVTMCAADRVVGDPSIDSVLDEQQDHDTLDSSAKAVADLRQRALTARTACTDGG